MKVEDAVLAATADASLLSSCLGQPVVAYHVTEIMREADAGHADAMRRAFMERSIEALVDDGVENRVAERFASLIHHRVGRTWRLLHMVDGTPH